MPHSSDALKKADPFLKWAGGKSKLLPALTRSMPRNFGTYFEPFVGGGAVFFGLLPLRARLSDANPNLVNAYVQIRDRVYSVIEVLQSLERQHSKRFFYEARAYYNASRTATGPVSAAYFIYLNKTCFNGLYRVNKAGDFNVPYGDRTFSSDIQRLEVCSAALQDVEISCEGYAQALHRAKEGDFVYMDPPYAPLSDTANFTGYTSQGFGTRAILGLVRVCESLHKRGVRFLLSNNDTPEIRKLFEPYVCEQISSFRSIASTGSKRTKTPELAIRNYLL